MTGPVALVGFRVDGRDVLIEARKRAVEAPRKPPGARHEQPLGVVHVAQDLPDAPLVGRVTDRRLMLGNAVQQLERFLSLVREDAADVRTRHALDVLEVVLRRLGPIGYPYDRLHRAPPLGSIDDVVSRSPAVIGGTNTTSS